MNDPPNSYVTNRLNIDARTDSTALATVYGGATSWATRHRERPINAPRRTLVPPTKHTYPLCGQQRWFSGRSRAAPRNRAARVPIEPCTDAKTDDPVVAPASTSTVLR